LIKGHTRPVAAVAVLALAALLAATAAFARSSDSTPVKVMVIAAVATPIQNYPDAISGAQSAADAINKAGGIKGHPVVVESCNTQSQANVATSCARQAVSDGVIAVIGQSSTLTTLETPILQASGIPDVGNFSSGNAIDWTNPDAFPVVGGVAISYVGFPFAFKALGKKKLAIFFQDVPSAATNAKNASVAARKAGIAYCLIQLPGATTDFSPYAQKLKDCGADSVEFINSPGVSGGLMRTAASLGITPLWGHNNGSIGEPEAAQIGSVTENMLLAAPFPTYRDTQYPGIKKWVQEMTAAGHATPADLKPNGMNSWISLHGLAMIANKMKGGVTASNLLAALRAQKKPLNLYGLAQWAPGVKGPAAFPRWSPNLQVYWLTVKNGQEVSYPGLKPSQPLKQMNYVH